MVGAFADWTSLAAGQNGVIGTRGDGTLWIWGYEMVLGMGYAAPTQRDPATDWREAAAGMDHDCALRSDGSLWCWGINTYGQLAGSTTSAIDPTRVGVATYKRRGDDVPDLRDSQRRLSVVLGRATGRRRTNRARARPRSLRG